MLRAIAIAALCLSVAHAAPPQLDPLQSHGKRIALVIGNDAYQKVSKLEKAGNDATAMARELKAAGFEVLLHRDLNYRGMVKAVETLSNSITGGDQVVVFFAGHGVQLKTGGYLLPIDIEASSESEVEKTAYGLNDLTEKLSEAKASFTLVMVDACRDNPIKSKGRSVGNARGLSAVEPPKGQMVVYSASKGQQALDRLNDGDHNPNGIFTREFIARMKRPGVRIEDLVREVQDAVEELARTVSHDQRPAIYNEARGNFYFFGPTTVQVVPQGGGTPAPVRVSSPNEIEDSYWNTIKNDRVAVGFEEYLKQYPKGRYAGQARIMLSKLKAEARQVAPSAPDDPESAMWSEVKSSGAREYLDAYLKQYPKGKYVALAKIELKKLNEREQQEGLRAEQQAWEQAKSDNGVAAYASYLERHPKGLHAALAQAGQQKAQREAAEREKQAQTEARRAEEERQRQQAAAEALRHEQEAREAVAERARQEAQRKADAEMKPGKVFRDCPDCPEMVILPAGSFQMGGENAGEKPVHAVTIAKPFAMGKTEVTQSQWRSVMGNNPSGFSSCGDDCPVESVNWDDAQEYVRKLSAKTGKTYRLPSEAEWEYACRAGDRQEYCGSDSVDSVAWYLTSMFGNKTHAVAGKQANAWGLYDMSGNVWEWTEDCWNKSYTGAPTDGGAWTTGECSVGRVLRGGSWNFGPRIARAAFRVGGVTTIRYSYYGFRLARMLP